MLGIAVAGILATSCAAPRPAPTSTPPPPPPPPATGTCVAVAQDATPEALPALAAEHGLPLVISGNAVLSCSCKPPPRRLAGDTEERRLGGDTEDRRLGGDTEERRLGGDTEDRHLGGDTEERHLGGDTEERRLGGDTEDRRLGGDVAALTCSFTSLCAGFEVAGTHPLKLYDGQAVRELPGRCVTY